jgi:hypothetical protein
MRRLAALFVAAIAVLVLAGCSGGSTPREKPFVGQWESTGGEKIAMRVDAPADGVYPVQITGENVDLGLSAKETGDQVYEAESTTTVWTFRMVDDELLTATAAPADGTAVSTSFKRIGD